MTVYTVEQTVSTCAGPQKCACVLVLALSLWQNTIFAILKVATQWPVVSWWFVLKPDLELRHCTASVLNQLKAVCKVFENLSLVWENLKVLCCKQNASVFKIIFWLYHHGYYKCSKLYCMACDFYGHLVATDTNWANPAVQVLLVWFTSAQFCNCLYYSMVHGPV